ncbi:MAG: hypothetical protein WC753_00620 [Candidatus Gracilibacteria bacterium]
MAETPSEPKISTKDILKDESKRKEALVAMRKSITSDIKELDPQKRAEAIRNLDSDRKMKLSQEWMKKAGFTEDMIQKAYAKLRLKKDSKPDEIINAVSKYQEDNKLATPGKGDGILGWKTLESLDIAMSADDSKIDVKGNEKNTPPTKLDAGNAFRTGTPGKYLDENGKPFEIQKGKDEKTLALRNNVTTNHTEQYDPLNNIWKPYAPEVESVAKGKTDNTKEEIRKLDVGNALLTGTPGKFIDAEGKPFEIKKDKYGGILALRNTNNKNTPEQYDIVDHIWEPYTDEQA